MFSTPQARCAMPAERPPSLPTRPSTPSPSSSDSVLFQSLVAPSVVPSILFFRVLVIIICVIVLKGVDVRVMVPIEAVVVIIVLVRSESGTFSTGGGKLADQVARSIGDHAGPCQSKGNGINICPVEEHIVLCLLRGGQIVAVIVDEAEAVEPGKG